jgi:Flp pilus assembly protein TadD
MMSDHRLGTLRRLACLLGLLAAPAANAAPFIPSDTNEILERVGPSRDPVEAELRRLSTALAIDRGNGPLAVKLARLSIARGQLLGDTRYFGRADAALAPWLNSPDPPIDVRLLRGILRQSNHDFTAALDDLGKVLSVEPHNGQARLTRAVVRLVRAEYNAARGDCVQLIGAAPQSVMRVCLAAVAAMTGHARAAQAALAITADQADTPPAVRVWALTLAGETAARTGDSRTAFGAFERARALAPDDAYLLAAYADALADAGRAVDVPDLLAAHTRIDSLLLRVAEAELQLRRHDPDLLAQLAERFETSRLRGETTHQREEARFALHILSRPDAALRLARANWQVQREPADARIFLEAAIAAGVPFEADPVLMWHRDNGVEDIQLTRMVRSIERVVR